MNSLKWKLRGSWTNPSEVIRIDVLAILLYHSCNLNLKADFCFVDYNTETLRMILDFIHTGGIVIDPSQKKILKQMKELLQCLNIKVINFT